MEEPWPKDWEEAQVQYVPPGSENNLTSQQQPQQLVQLPAAQSQSQQRPWQLPHSTYHLQLVPAVRQLLQVIEQCQDSHVLLPAVLRLVECVTTAASPTQPTGAAVATACSGAAGSSAAATNCPDHGSAAAAGATAASSARSAAHTERSTVATSNRKGSGSAAVTRDIAGT